MPEFQSHALLSIGRVLNPIGGEQAPTRVDFTSAMPIVYDASRVAEMASGFGTNLAPGYFVSSIALNHVAADTVRNAFDPHAIIGAVVGTPQEIDIWLLDLWLFSLDINVPLSSRVALFHPAYLGGVTGAQTGQLIWLTETAVAFSDVGAGGDDGTSTNLTSSPYRAHFPIFMAPGTVIVARSLSSAAGLENFSYKFWVAPKGVRPPGVA